jgi:hypothetical protein
MQSLAATFQPDDIQVAIFTTYDPHQDLEASIGSLERLHFGIS